MNNIIDPHLHFLELTQGQYHWLNDNVAPFWPDKIKIRKNFNEKALSLNQDITLSGFVHIEAGFDNLQPWREIAWLESRCTLPFKAVAGIDLTLNEDDFILQIKQLLTYQSVVGCRHILDEQAYDLLSQDSVRHNLAYLASNELSFDLQMSLNDKPAIDLLVNILKTLPTLRLIINHAGWPPIMASSIEPEEQQWQSGLAALSQFKYCAIKCSGWEMIDRHYQEEWPQQIINQCLMVFGDKRVMLASNFPLLLLKQDYHTLWQHYLKLHLTDKQLTALTYANAAYWYKFNKP